MRVCRCPCLRVNSLGTMDTHLRRLEMDMGGCRRRRLLGVDMLGWPLHLLLEMDTGACHRRRRLVVGMVGCLLHHLPALDMGACRLLPAHFQGLGNMVICHLHRGSPKYPEEP